MDGLILPLSNTQAKSLAGKSWTFNGQTYCFKDYDPASPGQPPWRSGAEGKAFPLLNASGQLATYLKFFTTPSQLRLERTCWLVAQQIHTWVPQLRAAPSAWLDSRQHGRPNGADFDLTGCLAMAARGETWLEFKYRLCEKATRFDRQLRWQCFRDLVVALAVLEQAGIVHGDLSPANILVDVHPASGAPALALIDFDAFVAQADSGRRLVLTAGEGGTYGTPGYCPPDLVEKSQAGDRSIAPYSDRHSRDMLLLELLLAGPEFPSEAPPGEWPPQKLERRYRAFLSAVPPNSTAAIAHLQPPAVFGFPEPRRPTSTDLAKTLALRLPSPAVKPFPISPPSPGSKPTSVPRPRPQPAPIPARPPATVKPKSRRWQWAAGILAPSVVLALAYWKLWTPAFQTPAPSNPPAPPSQTVPETVPTFPKTVPLVSKTVPPVPALGLELVKMEAGTFLMGSPSSEAGRDSDEGPQTQVRIFKGFWMGKYEVTQGQYEAVMETNPSNFKGGKNLPVENVSWDDADNFCVKLTERERQAGRLPAGYVYRLPTEAEWEYACRAGTTTRFSYGDDSQYAQLGEYAWYGVNSGNKPHPIRTRKSNAWGLYDMHGNVWEWCLDWYGTYPGGSVANPEGPGSGWSRVFRGGSWDYDGRYCRSAYRFIGSPDDRGSDLGFRPVLALGQ
jgi:formylglycine-generating enzyme required for sulfatase activity